MASIYQLKITLRGSKPPIWRRIVVPGSIKLSKLHGAILNAMGWSGGHLHEFITDWGNYGSIEEDDGGWESEVEDERKTRLDQVLVEAKDRLIHLYDFGDSWEHLVVLEKKLAGITLPGQKPVCLAGKGACPPEDCGGIYGYYQMLRILKIPSIPSTRGSRNGLVRILIPTILTGPT